MASIQIKGIYYAVPDQRVLYEEIKVGDSVQLKPDPRNTCDDHAIAVYYNFQRIGYVEMNRVVEVIGLIPEEAALSVHIDQVAWNEEEPKKSSMTFSIDDAKLECGNYSDYLKPLDLADDVWGYLRPPFLIYNEEGVQMLVAEYEHMMKYCLGMNVRDAERLGIIDNVTRLTRRYMELMGTSLSGDITLSMNAVRTGLQQFRRTFKSYDEPLAALCQQLEDFLSERYHNRMVIYQQQLAAIHRECDRHCGFFYRYSKLYLTTEERNMVALLEQRLKEVTEWLSKIPEDVAGFYFNDKDAFVEKLYYKRLPCITLNRIYLHILLYERLIAMSKDPIIEELRQKAVMQPTKDEVRPSLLYVNGNLQLHLDKADINIQGGMKADQVNIDSEVTHTKINKP